jgi:flagellar hook-basal body complex protein FliE
MNPIKGFPHNQFLPSIDQGKKDINDDNNFHNTLKTLISQVDAQLKDANQIAEEFAVGKNQNLHEVMIASEKADLSFQFLLQIRNKLLEAYHEIMRMNF